MKHELLLVATLVLIPFTASALDYPYQTAEPQKTGWPLTPEERSYVVDKPEYDRRPGRDANKHLPQLWPVVPCAGHWGGTSWLDTHAKLVEYVKANPGPCDVLLVGDSITQQWGSPLDKGVLNEAWKKDFASFRTINIGIGGDKTQNVLWRLDHGGVDGLQPKVVIVMIGNNNMFFTPETGIEPAAKGVQMCVVNLRDKFPKAAIIVAKILPCHAPRNTFYEDIKKTNAALDTLQLDRDPQVRMLDLTSDFTNPDGTLRQELFTPDNIHLSPAGYAVYAEKLKPLLEACFSGKPMPVAPATPSKASAAPASEKPAEPKPVDLPRNGGRGDGVMRPARTVTGIGIPVTSVSGRGYRNTRCTRTDSGGLEPESCSVPGGRVLSSKWRKNSPWVRCPSSSLYGSSSR